MRRVTFGVGNSLDNFIAGRDHSTDWLTWDDEIAGVSAEFWRTIDTVLMGRKTYEVALAMGTRAYPGVRNCVFSRTLRPPPDADVEIVTEDAAAFTRRLKSEAGRGICVMGGGELAHALFEADLIDQVGVNIQPVLLGEGIPLFHPLPRRTRLELLQSRVLRAGSVYLLYKVLH